MDKSACARETIDIPSVKMRIKFCSSYWLKGEPVNVPLTTKHSSFKCRKKYVNAHHHIYPFYRAPAPRFLGCIQIPLSRLIYGKRREKTTTATTTETFYWMSGSPTGSPKTPLLQSVIKVVADGQEALSVYPLFRHAADDLKDCWVSATFQMTSKKSLDRTLGVCCRLISQSNVDACH